MHSPAKVSQHIPDVSLSLSLRKDRSLSLYPSQRKSQLRPSLDVIHEIDQNYTWKKLPNIASYKNAIVRNKVCEGLLYLLPGNKNATSLARPYTAQLGAMFSYPYQHFKPDEYDEKTVLRTSRVHFSPSSHVNRLSKQEVATEPSDLNNDSRTSYQAYDTLARNKSHSTLTEGKGNLPAVSRLGPAEVKLQKEVDGILSEVGVSKIPVEKPEDVRQQRLPQSRSDSTAKSVRFDEQIEQPQHTDPPIQNVREFRGQAYSCRSAKFKNYSELKDAGVPQPRLPEEMRSRYLDAEKSEQIWNWLNWDFKKTKFDHFLEVCS